MDRFLLIFENLTFSDSSWHLAFTPSSAQIVPVSLVAGRHGRQSPFAPGALHLIPGSFIHRFVALVVLQKPANFQSQETKGNVELLQNGVHHRPKVTLTL